MISLITLLKPKHLANQALLFNRYSVTSDLKHSLSQINSKDKQAEYDEFGRKYPPLKGQYLVPSITTDSVVLRKRKSIQDKYDILMITRKGEPYKDHLAFPGGFLDYNEEPSKGCLRELKEETGLEGKKCELLTVKGEPQRDPREHIVTIFYKVEVDDNQIPVANDDAALAEFYSLEYLLSSQNKIAFDHYDVLLMLQQILNHKNNKD